MAKSSSGLQEFLQQFSGQMQTQTQAQGLPTAADFRASDEIGTELLRTDVDPATRSALETAARAKALGEKSGAVGQAVVAQNIIGGRNLETISGLGQDTQDLVDSFGVGGEDGSTLGSVGFDAFEQGVGGISGLLANPSSILDDPLIQAQLKKGISGLEMGAAASGTQLSSGQLRNLQGFGQTFAGEQIDAQLGRFNDLAGLGLEGIAGGVDVNRLQLEGQGDVSNLALAGVDLSSGLAQQELGVQIDMLASRNAKRGQNKALVGQAVGLGVSQFGKGGSFAEGGTFG